MLYSVVDIEIGQTTGPLLVALAQHPRAEIGDSETERFSEIIRGTCRTTEILE